MNETLNQNSAPESTGWESLGNIAFNPGEATAQAAESAESQNFTPESMKDFQNVLTELSELGADRRFTENPAFQGILKNTLDNFGLARALDLSGGKESGHISLETKGATQKDAMGHDRGLYDLSVNPDGSVTLKAACLDRATAKLSAKDLFPAYQGGPNSTYIAADGTTECVEDKNLSTIITFGLPQTGDGIYVKETSAYEDQYVPANAPEHHANGADVYYFASKSERTSFFDASGKETSREDVRYQNYVSNLSNAAFTGGRNQELITPADRLRATWSLVDGTHVAGRLASANVAERISYLRNPDNTLTVTGGRSDGTKLNKPNVALNTEYGDAEIIPAPGEITDADWQN